MCVVGFPSGRTPKPKTKGEKTTSDKRACSVSERIGPGQCLLFHPTAPGPLPQACDGSCQASQTQHARSTNSTPFSCCCCPITAPASPCQHPVQKCGAVCVGGAGWASTLKASTGKIPHSPSRAQPLTHLKQTSHTTPFCSFSLQAPLRHASHPTRTPHPLPYGVDTERTPTRQALGVSSLSLVAAPPEPRTNR